jgi:hypothetical protein
MTTVFGRKRLRELTAIAGNSLPRGLGYAGLAAC